jgi:hypothetical protein
MSHILVPRELLAKALIEFDGLDSVAFVRSMNKLRALLDAPCEPKYTTGHCRHHQMPGGCQLPNVQCGYPKCDREETP